MRTAFTDLVGVPHPIVGFNRSPGVVAAVTNAGGLGVLAASAYTPAELDAQLTWIEDRTGGKPYGVDLLVPEKFTPGDPDRLVASLRAQIPAGHLAFVRDLLDRYGIPEAAPHASAQHDEIAASLNPAGAAALLDVAFRHPISLVASALGIPPPGLVARAKAEGVAVAALVGQPRHAVTVRSPTRTGKPARQLRSAWHEEWERPGSPPPLPMPLQPMLVNDAWQRIDAAAQAGHEGAIRLESFFVGQVVGSFQRVRPAAEITRQIVADCEQRIADLARTLPGAAS